MADQNRNNTDGYIAEKLYSPLFVRIYEYDNRDQYGGDYWSDPISQRDAVQYEDEIHTAILKERRTGEEPRGLMSYYHDGGGVDDKVHSLYVDVEEIGGRL